MKTAYIINGYRTAVGKAPRGTFRFKRPDELAAETIAYLLKKVPELDFYMTTTYYNDNERGLIKFVRTANRGGASTGIAWKEGNTIFLEAFDKTSRKLFKYSYFIKADGTLSDEFYRRDTSGKWKQGHLIHYRNTSEQYPGNNNK